MQGDIPRWSSASARAAPGTAHPCRPRGALIGPGQCRASPSGQPSPRPQLQVGDQVMHASFGVGEITHTFGSGEKVSIAVKFVGMAPWPWIRGWRRSSQWIPIPWNYLVLLDLLTPQDAACECGVTRLALVGGAVRDALLHHQHQEPWRGLPDLDLVVEGSAEALAQHLLQRCGDERVSELRVHGSYGTVELMLDGVLLDLATSRQGVTRHRHQSCGGAGFAG